MKNKEDEVVRFLAELENMTLAEQYQLKQELKAYINSPQAKVLLWLAKGRRDSCYFLLKQDWLSHFFERWFRLHRLNEFALCQLLRQKLDSDSYNRWNRFSNRLNRLSLGRSPWRDE